MYMYKNTYANKCNVGYTENVLYINNRSGWTLAWVYVYFINVLFVNAENCNFQIRKYVEHLLRLRIKLKDKLKREEGCGKYI